MARRDDSNKFVVTVTAFNRVTRDPLVLITLLAVLVLWVLWLFDIKRKPIRLPDAWRKSIA